MSRLTNEHHGIADPSLCNPLVMVTRWHWVLLVTRWEPEISVLHSQEEDDALYLCTKSLLDWCLSTSDWYNSICLSYCRYTLIYTIFTLLMCIYLWLIQLYLSQLLQIHTDLHTLYSTNVYLPLTDTTPSVSVSQVIPRANQTPLWVKHTWAFQSQFGVNGNL